MGKIINISERQGDASKVNQEESNNTLAWILLCIAIGLLFMVFTPQSIIKNQIDWDSGIFFQCGREIAKGKVMFKDIADAKGLYIFLLNAVAASISMNDSTGLFIIECIFMSLMTVFIFKTAMIVTCGDKRSSFISTLIMEVININPYHTSSGNFTEWYVLLFQYISMYLLIKHFYITEAVENRQWGSNNKKWSFINHNAKYMFIHGLNVGIAINFKVSYVLYFIPLLLLINIKNKRNTIQNIVYGIAGVLTGCIPTIIYCTATNSWNEMIWHSIKFNIVYSRLEKGGLPLKMVITAINILYGVTLTIYIICILYIIAKYKRNGSKRKLATILTAAAIMIYIGISISGKCSRNYFISMFPIALIPVIGISRVIRDKYIPVMVSLIILALAQCIGNLTLKQYENGAELEYKDELLEAFDNQYEYIDRSSMVNIGYGCKAEVRYDLESDGTVSIPLLIYNIYNDEVDKRINKLVQQQPDIVLINGAFIGQLGYTVPDEVLSLLNNEYKLVLSSEHGNIKTGIPLQGIYIRRERIQ